MAQDAERSFEFLSKLWWLDEYALLYESVSGVWIESEERCVFEAGSLFDMKTRAEARGIPMPARAGAPHAGVHLFIAQILSASRTAIR
jgi:hypothetical protein